MDDKSTYSSEEWTTIEMVPVAIFYYVAKADGTIDEKEIHSFRSKWRRRAIRGKKVDERYIDMFLREMFNRSAGSSFEEIQDKIKGYSVNQIKTLLVKFRRLIEKLSKEDQKHIKEIVMGLAMGVASASGGFISKVSASESKAIAAIKLMLRA